MNIREKLIDHLSLGAAGEMQSDDWFLSMQRLAILVRYLKHRNEEISDVQWRRIVVLLPVCERERTLARVSGLGLNDKKKRKAAVSVSRTVELLQKAWNSATRRPEVKHALTQAFGGMVLQLRRDHVNDTSEFCARLCELQELFQLQDYECECLLVLFLAESDSLVEDMLDQDNYSDLRGKIQQLSDLSSVSRSKIAKALSVEGKLRTFRLIDYYLDIQYSMVEYLSGLTRKALRSCYFEEYCGQTLGAAQLQNVTYHLNILKTLLSSGADGVNILFYGPPGVGKTECARSLGRELGLGVFEITHPFNATNDACTLYRFAGLKACLNQVDQDRSMIIVDEADEMLCGDAGVSLFGDGRNTRKSLINDVLDQRKGRVIWITNYSEHIDQSTRRRFDYAVEFTKYSRALQQQVWNRTAEKYDVADLMTPELIAQLRTGDLSPGGIDVVVRNCQRVLNLQEDREITVETVEQLLSSHKNLMDMSNPLLPGVVGNYSLAGLNIKGNTPLEEVVGCLRSFRRELENCAERSLVIRNMNVLLYGPPGTGKTEFSRYLAEELGAPLVVKRGSDLLGQYVGETEKAICQAFKEAAQDNAVVFLDEADSLIAKRQGSARNWEVSMVNEFLTQIEGYKGIVICATNFRQNLDSAAMRRFNFKLQFDYLDKQGKELFFERILRNISQAQLSVAERDQLSRLENLTPGDFKVVFQKAYFARPEQQTNSAMIKALAEEVGHKGPSIGTARIGF